VAGPLSRRIPHGAGAENIAAGTRDFPTTLAMWKRSSGHNANLLNRSMTRIGIASAQSSNSRYGTFWALILAGSPAQPRIGQPARMRGAAAKREPARAEAPWFVNRQLGLQ
jgi:hypothetical protein